MAVSQIKMPQLGESVTEGTVDKWLKHEGDFVKRDEPLVEVVTDKVNAEIPSPFEGKLVKIAVSEGETVRVGAVIAQIETGGATAAPAEDKEAGVAHTELPPEPPGGKAPTATAAPVAAGEADGGERARLSPAVRKLAAEHNIDPTSLKGSGMGGRVTRDDVLAAVGGDQTGAAPQAPTKPAPSAPARVDGEREELGFTDLVRVINDLVERARNKQLKTDDVQGGTFTLNNTGATGSIASQPIINQPQAAILTTESIVKRAMVIDDAIALRHMMNLCLSFDHRIIDGMMAGQFLGTLKQRLEEWTAGSIGCEHHGVPSAGADPG